MARTARRSQSGTQILQHVELGTYIRHASLVRSGLDESSYCTNGSSTYIFWFQDTEDRKQSLFLLSALRAPAGPRIRYAEW